MKRIWPIALVLTIVCVLSGTATSSALAAEDCLRAADAGGTERYTLPNCSGATSPNGAYVRISVGFFGLFSNRFGIACGQTWVELTGVWSDSACSMMAANKKWIRVFERPNWFIAGVQLKQGAKQIKLQVKGKAALEGKIVGLGIRIECSSGASEGATIEGNGVRQGQDKGRITFSQCSTKVPKCKVEEPITTVQTKSRLVNIGGQNKYADLFEPQEGTTFTNIKIVKGTEACPVAGEFPVKGSAAAEVIPGEQEGQEGLLNFPATPIEKVLVEGAEQEVKLSLGSEPAKFGAALGARLATNEPYGVFGSN